MNAKRFAILLTLALFVASFFVFDLRQWMSISAFQTVVAENPFEAALVFFFIYVVVTATSLPGAVPLTLIGGAVFGLGWGVVLVSFASTLGATLAMLASRFLLRDWVQQRFADPLSKVNAGVEKEGASYLFSLRLIPLVPFFVINLVFGLMPISAWRFYWVSQLGMLAGTAVYVNAGAQLGAADSLSVSGVFTPAIIISFVLLGLFPFIAKRALPLFKAVVKRVRFRLQSRRLSRRFDRPSSFDANVVVIGAGAAGLVSAYISAAVKAKVVLIEKHKMGGDCLNTGCVPSKALIQSARVAHQARRASDYGVELSEPRIDFDGVMDNVRRAVTEIEPHDSIERYTKLGVECVTGDAEVLSPWAVRVGDRTITARHIIIASGARPFVPPIPGIDTVTALTSDSLWDIKSLPPRLLVMGAGPIGCELAQSFQRLGSQVDIVDLAGRVLPREDDSVSEIVGQQLGAEGITLRLESKVIAFGSDAEGQYAVLESSEGETRVNFDAVLVAVGRKANVQGFGLEKLDLPTTPDGRLLVDEYLRTPYASVLACGDVAGPYQFTHVAAHQAWYAAVNSLFGCFKLFPADYRVIPWAIFTDPEVARVGLSEAEAREKGLDIDVTRYGIDDLDRAIAEGEAQGFVKVITPKGSDKILGAIIVGSHSAELITEFVTAMKYNLGLNKILGTIHLYPSWAEANKYAAGEWKRANAPEKVLRWVEKYHRWMRG